MAISESQLKNILKDIEYIKHYQGYETKNISETIDSDFQRVLRDGSYKDIDGKIEIKRIK